MERKDLLLENAKIFIEQGKALDAVAARDIKVLVVGNPANTNAYIAMKSAPSLPKKNFTAMMRLDHNRALSQLAAKAGVPVGSIEKLVVWGNHSPTMYPDYRFATAGGKSLKDLINDEAWNRDEFLPKVGKRGAAIIEARGLSSAASAANAAIDHVRDWVLGSNGKWVTMGIASDGSYGIPQDVMYGLPVTTASGEYSMRARPAHRRVLAREDERHAEGARGRARRRGVAARLSRDARPMKHEDAGRRLPRLASLRPAAAAGGADGPAPGWRRQCAGPQRSACRRVP